MSKKSKFDKPTCQVERKFFKKGYALVIGVDEAGRGPLAGPVVAAAVSLKSSRFFHKIADSKKMTARQRVDAFHEIQQKAGIGIGIISSSVIDEHNILQATFYAMSNAVEDLVRRVAGRSGQNALDPGKVKLLVDGKIFRSDLPYTFETIVKGDQSCLSIACASIIAKVSRDRILGAYDRLYPQYGFKRHKGYPTRAHKAAIAAFGLSHIHRKTFCHL